MPELPLFNMEGENLGKVAVSEGVFGRKSNIPIVHSALTWYLASRRRGTASAKTRSEVRGGGIKPWRQKGTGRARVGSIRSPLWRGGGVIFGPKPRDYSYRLPKKVRKLALKVALSDKLREGKIAVIEELSVKQGKTKEMVKVLENLKLEKVLMVVSSRVKELERAASNISGVELIPAKDLNIYDLVRFDSLLLSKDAVTCLEGALS